MKRFYPCADARSMGVLSEDGHLHAAQFISVAQARCNAIRERRQEERELLRKLRTEAAQPEWYPER